MGKCEITGCGPGFQSRVSPWRGICSLCCLQTSAMTPCGSTSMSAETSWECEWWETGGRAWGRASATSSLRYVWTCEVHAPARGVLQNLHWGLPLEHFYFLFSNFLRFVCECVWSEMVVLLCMVRAAWKTGSVEADTKQNILGFVHTGVKEVTLP